jgi:hypothetical protein
VIISSGSFPTAFDQYYESVDGLEQMEFLRAAVRQRLEQ